MNQEKREIQLPDDGTTIKATFAQMRAFNSQITTAQYFKDGTDKPSHVAVFATGAEAVALAKYAESRDLEDES